MPVYSVVIDRYDSKNIIVGTELGVYSSNLNGSNWEPEFNGLPTTPVLTLNQEQVYDLDGDCYILYAGTYGKGSYASSTLSPVGCEIPKGNFSTGIEDQSLSMNGELKVYPNPASEVMQVEFSLQKEANPILLIYDLNGWIVLEKALGHFSAGNYKQQVQLNTLTSGQYIMVLRTRDNQLVQKLSIM